MMGDGLHLEPDGKWISRDYKKVLKVLGMLPKQTRTNNSEAINEAMEKRVEQVSCQKCNGKLKQTRKGSKRAQCEDCGSKYQLLK
ncbi:putative cell division control protein [Vibrio phage 424E50-1]|nr:putative cell division control protein [Vibrio phage 424E50-1]